MKARERTEVHRDPITGERIKVTYVPGPRPAFDKPAGPVKYTHAAARMRDAIRITPEEGKALAGLVDWCCHQRDGGFDVAAAARAVDRARRGLELYRVTKEERG